MKGFVIVCLVTITASCAQPTRDAGLPRDAAKMVDRVATCLHFSGEFNGDGSDRDKEIAATMTGLHCDTVDQDASAIRRKYADNRAVLDALEQASEL